MGRLGQHSARALEVIGLERRDPDLSLICNID